MTRRYELTSVDSDLTGGNIFTKAMLPNSTNIETIQSVTVPASSTSTNYFVGPIGYPGELFQSSKVRIGMFNQGFDRTPYGSKLQADGKRLVFGTFNSYGNRIAGGIIRFNTDGTVDETFDVGIGFSGAIIRTLAIQEDGKILVGGAFTTFQGTARSRIARLNEDGSLDTTFTTEFNNTVQSLAIQSDGKIVVVGSFTVYSRGTASAVRNRIIRLDTAGIIDNSFTVGSAFNNFAYDIAIQSDGKIIVGGAFTNYQDISRGRLVRLNSDGTYDSTFSPMSVLSTIERIVPDPNGKFILMGSFTYRIARINSNGSQDTSFNVGSGFNNTPSAIYFHSDGRMIIGGDFTTYQGISRSRIIRVNSDGSIDNSFVVGTGFNSQVMDIFEKNGNLQVIGFFNSYKNKPCSRTAIIDFSGNLLDTDGASFAESGFLPPSGVTSGAIYTIATQSDGKILIGSDLSQYQGGTSNNLIRLNSDGSRDTSFNIGTGPSSTVRSIAIQPDGKILVGGEFASFNGTSYNRLVRLNSDGSIDSTFNIGTGFNNTVYTIALQADGKILVGGNYTTYQSTTRNRIVRLNTDGSFDSTFVIGNGFSNFIVQTIVVQPNGAILAGGTFTNYQGTTRNRLVRITSTGTYDTTFLLGTGFNDAVQSIALQADGKIIVVGDYTTYQGTIRNRIVRLNTDGSFDSTFVIGNGLSSSGNSTVYDCKIQSDGKIIVSGNFTTYQDITRNRIIRLNTDGSVDETFNVGVGFNRAAVVTNILSDDSILVGGFFNYYKDTAINFLTKLDSAGNVVDAGIRVPQRYNEVSTSSLVVSCQVSTANSDHYLTISAQKINSAGQLLSTTSTSEIQLSTTGPKTAEFDLQHLGAFTESNRLRIGYSVRNAAASEQTSAIALNHPDSYVSGTFRRRPING